MQKWEYLKKTYISDEYDLNKLGEQGWELVAVTFNENGSPQEYFFKRPK